MAALSGQLHQSSVRRIWAGLRPLLSLLLGRVPGAPRLGNLCASPAWSDDPGALFNPIRTHRWIEDPQGSGQISYAGGPTHRVSKTSFKFPTSPRLGAGPSFKAQVYKGQSLAKLENQIVLNPGTRFVRFEVTLIFLTLPAPLAPLPHPMTLSLQ